MKVSVKNRKQLVVCLTGVLAVLLAAVLFAGRPAEKAEPEAAESSPTPDIFALEGSEPDEQPPMTEEFLPGEEETEVGYVPAEPAGGGAPKTPVSTNPPRISTEEEAGGTEDKKPGDGTGETGTDEPETSPEPSQETAEPSAGREEDIIGKVSF